MLTQSQGLSSKTFLMPDPSSPAAWASQKQGVTTSVHLTAAVRVLPLRCKHLLCSTLSCIFQVKPLHLAEADLDPANYPEFCAHSWSTEVALLLLRRMRPFGVLCLYFTYQLYAFKEQFILKALTHTCHLTQRLWFLNHPQFIDF